MARKLDALNAQAQQIETLYGYKLAALMELKQAILHKAFAGELAAQPEKAREEVAA